MQTFTLKYGITEQSAPIPPDWRGDIIESSYTPGETSLGEKVRRALESPIYSPRLSDLVKEGERVCIVFSDITRSWQGTDIYLPLIVEELERGGVRPGDITLLSALGTHRPHSEEEKKSLTGSLYGRYPIVDHDCDDDANLVKVGTTSRGTEVELNRLALEADRLIITGGILFHLMAGYSGGRKSLVPGIASRRTIMQNHSLSLHPEKGKGSHPLIGCDKLIDNPLHEDLMEALEMVKPDFLVNIVPGTKGPGAAVAGHYDRAHREGCRLLRDFFLIPIPERRDAVVASAHGFPGDINFYQSVKSMINACQALKPGGTLILATRSQEGLGNPLMEEMIGRFASMEEREAFLRENYSIGRFIAYYGCELASRFRVLLVTEMVEPSLARADIKTFATLEEALEVARSALDGEVSYWCLPDASHSFPRAD